ncbi:hypothetical protein [Aquirhabdus sp.]|uniref:hypothetical protein n=1 Tax=Aquirhabdus sp. TaxID=2824160 RepID=UPI00396C7ABE
MSLVERVLARPTLMIALVVAVIALILGAWLLLGSNKSSVVAAKPSTPATVQPVSVQDTTVASAASAVIASTPVPAVNVASAPLPTDKATAAEELDRLHDENSRLNERKAQLAKQLETSNKILALKEQQIKELEKNPL